MPTIQQLIRMGRKSKARRSKAADLGRCPQRRGVCLRGPWLEGLREALALRRQESAGL